MDADLKAQKVKMVKLHIDRAYLASRWVKERPQDLTIFCKVAASLYVTRERFTKTDANGKATAIATLVGGKIYLTCVV